MTVEVKVRKHHSRIRANQEDNNEDGHFFSESLPSPRERRVAGKALQSVGEDCARQACLSN
jgi:hypothetical protein